MRSECSGSKSFSLDNSSLWHAMQNLFLHRFPSSAEGGCNSFFFVFFSNVDVQAHVQSMTVY